eukprot:scaffold903_cov124-Cylindrotheca_fusiformis.AAC.1
MNNLIDISPKQSSGPPFLIADTGATANYASIRCPIRNKQLATRPIRIQTPNGEIMESTHICELDIPELRPAARHAHVVPALHNCSLLSIGAVCDAGYVVKFDKNSMRILDDGECVLTGTRQRDTGMWHVDAPMRTCPAPAAHFAPEIATPTSPAPCPNCTPKVNPPTSTPVILPIPEFQAHALSAPKAAELVSYAHAALFSPALSTLEKALAKGYLINFPGLSLQTLRQNPPVSLPMIKGHMDQIRQNVRSTK